MMMTNTSNIAINSLMHHLIISHILLIFVLPAETMNGYQTCGTNMATFLIEKGGEKLETKK
jgi:hypothetical protein